MWKILVVDDNESNRQLAVDILSEKAECQVAVDGRQALKALEKYPSDKPFDLVLLDVAMPEMDGVAFLKELRLKEEKAGIVFGKGLPVIMVTAYKMEFYKSFQSGCDDFIIKPLDPDTLIKKISEKLNV